MRTRVQELMLKHLLEIQADGPKDPNFGICHLINRELPFAHGEVMTELDILFTSWPKFSGDPMYPVPHPEQSADEAYLLTKGSMWRKPDEYGQNRWALLDHLIVQLQSYSPQP